MKFLVLGATGMAGHIISIYLQERGYEVVGFSRNKVKYVKSIEGDAKDTYNLTDIIRNGKFDAVINSIGILNKFAEDEPQTAVFLNSYLPHFLADITSDLDTQIIQMSTDCVFSGERGGYTETSFRDGKTFYDRSKALGELEDNKNITFRNSIVGPDTNYNGIGLLNWFMKQNGSVYGYANAIWTGVTTLELAKVMEAAAKEKVHGLFNMVYQESINKYELLKLFNHYLRDNEIVINPCDKVTLDKSLIRTNFDFNYEVPDYDRMIYELYNWMLNHKYLYPHYNL
ncbi:SDR family oxidoreductase [Bacillus sp. CHD6a]|uniref:SDR family oxidoreductase n=1 Tax=Bacillus sp. CHD6a TaxID=1643452 RepID=UPI0006CE1BB0|nr:sugar nucleotide-binding protein [Bacillus sp. CHD6a]KPB05737.1 reductase [Bacillus sp. CHD6a]